MTQCAPTTSTTFRKHNVITIFVILKSGTFLSSYQFFFFFLGGGGGGGRGVLVRSGLNAVWFLVNSHYKRLCACLCTFETVQVIEK